MGFEAKNGFSLLTFNGNKVKWKSCQRREIPAFADISHYFHSGKHSSRIRNFVPSEPRVGGSNPSGRNGVNIESRKV